MIEKIIKPALIAALVFGLIQLPVARAASPGASTNLFPDPVVATGKGFEIKRSQVDEAYLDYSASQATKGGAIPESARGMVRSNLLNQLIVDRILLQMATPDEKTATQKMVNDAIDSERTNSPATFDAKVRATGMTLEQVRDRAIDQQLCRRVLVRETTNGITISDADVKKFYDDNPTAFEVPERVHVAHILVSTLDPITQAPLPPDQKKEKEKLANELKQRAEKGEDFAKLVKQYSDDPGSKDKGGEYTFAKNHQMRPEFESAAFSLKVNQISDPVETVFGYHIIKLIEKLPPKKEQLADVSEKVHDYLVGQQANKGLEAYLEKLKSKSDVKILDDGTSDNKPAPAPATK